MNQDLVKTLENMGTITVKILWVKVGQETTPKAKCPTLLDTVDVSEKALKGRAISHSARFVGKVLGEFRD